MMYDSDSKNMIQCPRRVHKVHKLDDFLSRSKPIGNKQIHDLDSFEQTLTAESQQDIRDSIQFIGNTNILIRVNMYTNAIHVFSIRDYYCAQTLIEEINSCKSAVQTKKHNNK